MWYVCAKLWHITFKINKRFKHKCLILCLHTVLCTFINKCACIDIMGGYNKKKIKNDVKFIACFVLTVKQLSAIDKGKLRQHA